MPDLCVFEQENRTEAVVWRKEGVRGVSKMFEALTKVIKNS